MKQLIFFFFLSLLSVSLSSCAFLGGKEDSAQEDLYDEEEMDEDPELVEDEEELLVEEEEDEEDFSEGEEEESGGLIGFFSRIFSSSDEDEEEFPLDGEEDSDNGFVVETGEEEDYAEEEEFSSEESEESSEEISPLAPPEESPPTVQPSTPAPPKPSVIPLKKIATAPYEKAGYLVNAVYIARPNDTLESISQKIYGSSQLDSLSKINPQLKSRSVKVGDKIYYNSPTRAQDRSQLLFYYQDINASSSVHSLSPGDNIRKVSAQLLGHPNSWKEIWATNPNLKSKGDITESVNIIYWPKETVAKAPPVEDKKETAVEEEKSVSSLPPAGTDENLENLEPPSPELKDDFPPLPPGDKLVSPEKDKKPGLFQAILGQKELLVALIGIVVVLILIIRLILKKRRQRDFDYTATNIEV